MRFLTLWPAVLFASIGLTRGSDDDPKMRGVERIYRQPYPKGFGGDLGELPVERIDLGREPSLAPGSIQRFGRAWGRLPPWTEFEFSPDGKRLASFLSSDQLRVWDAETLTVLADITGPGGRPIGDRLTRPRFSADGSKLWLRWLVGNDNWGRHHSSGYYEFSSNKFVEDGKLTAAAARVDFVTPDDTKRLEGDSWDKVRLVERKSGDDLGGYSHLNNGFSHGCIACLSPSGKYLAWSHAYDVKVVESRQKEAVPTPRVGISEVSDLRFRDDSAFVYVGKSKHDAKCRLAIVALPSGKTSERTIAGEWPALTHDATAYASVVGDDRGRVVELREVEKDKLVASFALGGEVGNVFGLTIAPDRSKVVVDTPSGSLLYRVRDGRCLNPMDRDGGPVEELVSIGAGRWLAVAGGVLRLWDEGRAVEVKKWGLAAETIVSAAASFDGSEIAVASVPVDSWRDRSGGSVEMSRVSMVRRFDPATMREVGRSTVRSGRFVEKIRPHPSGIGWDCKTDSYSFWNLGTPDAPQQTHKFYDRQVRHDTFGPWDLPRFASCLPPRTLGERDTLRSERIKQFQNFRQEVELRELDLFERGSDGPIAKSSGRPNFGDLRIDGPRRLVRVVPRPIAYSLIADPSAFDLGDLADAGQNVEWPHLCDGAALAPDGRLFAALSSSAIVFIEAETGLERFRVAPGAVPAKTRSSASQRLTFSRDGRSLAVIMADGTATVWPVYPRREGEPALTAPELQRCYSALRGEDPAKIDPAIRFLIARPREAVPFLSGELPRKVAAADAARLREAIKGFREAALAETESATAAVLMRFGVAGLRAVEAELKSLSAVRAGEKPTPLARRLDALAAKMRRQVRPYGDLELLRQVRCVEVLDRIGTKEARDLLAILAERGGTPALQFEAGVALGR